MTTHNDLLRQLRGALHYDDATLAAIFTLGGHPVAPEAVAALLKKAGAPGHQPCTHPELECFLNGLIIHRRGRKAGAPEPVKNPDALLTNNDILKKLRIALDLHEEEMLAILQQTGLEITKYDLSDLFRKDGHKHYKDCSDALLGLFLKGLAARYRLPAPGGTTV
ncbi:MAG: DUF1456 family protein [Lentisphaeria bacterium]